jgi:DNA repair protein RadC
LGNVRPSEADVAITKQLVEASKIIGIRLLDHVIISNSKFMSVNVSY